MSAVDKAEFAPKLGYWFVRSAIIKASQEKDDETLKKLAKEYPETFNNVVNFARNQSKK